MSYVMAGVPMIMRAMMEDIEPGLKRGAVVHSITVRRGSRRPYRCRLGAHPEDIPSVAIGSYPFYREDGSGVQFVARGRDLPRVEAAAGAIEAMIRAEGKNPNAWGTKLSFV